jgi:uncharacterized repeat protein (TIGR04138 family)
MHLTASTSTRKVFLMPCLKCGASNPTFHLTQVLDGVKKTRDYCESCFDLGAISEEMGVEAKACAQSQNKAESNSRIQQAKNAFRVKLEEICESDPRFSFEAHEFILKSLQKALTSNGRPRRCGEHINASQVVNSVCTRARKEWGSDAPTQLKRLGIESSSDVGEIIFLLVKNQCLGKDPEDKQSDFDGLPFLEE